VTALRRATHEDLAAIVALQQAAYAKNRAILGVEPLPLMVDYAAIFPQYEFWVAGGAQTLDGVLILQARADDLLIWSIASAPGSQGRGIANMMLEFAEIRAREVGLACIRLYTGEKLVSNIAWYLRHGYLLESTEDLGDRMCVNLIKKLG
jgi:ribosomal protein S18 acetylase RimI-like enzyme